MHPDVETALRALFDEPTRKFAEMVQREDIAAWAGIHGP